MNTSWAHLIVIRSRQESLTDSLIDHKHHLCRHLGTEKAGLFHAHHTGIFPFGEILGRLDHFDVGWCLGVTSVKMEVLWVWSRDLKARWRVGEVLGLRLVGMSGGHEEWVDAMSGWVMHGMGGLTRYWSIGTTSR